MPYDVYTNPSGAGYQGIVIVSYTV
jgi:hypothetical protein